MSKPDSGSRSPSFPRLRGHLSAHLPLYVFLGFFFLTTVLANLIYQTPWGRNWPARSISGFSWERFSVQFGVEYWLLLVVPFIVAPMVALSTGALVRPLARKVAPRVPDFSLLFYGAICVGLYSYVFFRLHQADALGLLIRGRTAQEAVQARFALLEALGYWPQAALKSVLVFLAVYTVVKATRHGGWFWITAVFAHTTALFCGLILLNMKWPVLIFVITLGMTVLVTARRYAWLQASGLMAVSVVIYLLLSVALLRWVGFTGTPADQPGGPPAVASDAGVPAAAEPSAATQPPLDAAAAPPTATAPPPPPKAPDLEDSLEVAASAKELAPTLLILAVNRMAVAAPYYYDVFRTEGSVCGTIGDRILRQEHSCEPSNYVYREMFGADGFEGRGTAPAAVQLSGFALGGWPGAIVSLVLASAVIGSFLALWPLVRQSDVIAAVFVMGGYTAYFFTQLPFEGPLVYDHGLLWWSLLVVGHWALVFALGRTLLARSRAPLTGPAGADGGARSDSAAP